MRESPNTLINRSKRSTRSWVFEFPFFKASPEQWKGDFGMSDP